MAQTKSQKILRYSMYGLGGVVFLGAVSYILVIRPLQIRAQKQSFDKAEARLDALAVEIEQKIGKPDQIKKEKSCGRANLKSEEGPLGCGTTVSMLYTDSDAVKSTETMNKVLSTRNATVRIGSGSASGSAFVPRAEQTGTQVFYEDLFSFDEINCVLSYRYPSALDQNAVTSEESFALGLSCNGPAMKEFYSLKD